MPQAPSTRRPFRLDRACAVAFLTVFQGMAGAQAAPPAVPDVPPGVNRHNVYAAGAAIRLDNPVDGDLFAAAGKVTIDHPVTGDATLAAGAVSVRSPVAGDVRAIGGDVAIESGIGGELKAAGGNLTVAKSSRVDGDASLAGGLVNLDGKVMGDARINAQRIVVRGEISGNAHLAAEQIDIEPTARFGGSLIHASHRFKLSKDAAVVGAVTREEPAAINGHGESRPSWGAAATAGWGVLSYLGLLAAGALLVLVFPNFLSRVTSEAGKSPWVSLGTGLGVMLGVPVVAVLFIVTVLGIPLGFLAFMLYPLALMLGYLAGVLFIAQRAWRQVSKSAGRPSDGATIGAMAASLLALTLMGLLPFVGKLIALAVTAVGLGACVLEWLHRRRTPTGSPGPSAG